MKASKAASASASRLGHPDVLQCPLGLRLQALRQLVQDVRGFVHPAALLARRRPDLAERLPEAERAVGDGELRGDRQTAPLQIEQQLAPVLRALAGAVGEADQLLLALRRRADNHEHALLLVFEPRLQIDAVGPDVDVAPGRQVALLPARVLVDPNLLQPRDRRGRQARRILAEQRAERILEVTGRDALQVEDRDQHFEALRAPRIGRQYRRREPDALAVGGRPGRARAAGARQPARCRS